jgi:hypothetical protein
MKAWHYYFSKIDQKICHFGHAHFKRLIFSYKINNKKDLALIFSPLWRRIKKVEKLVSKAVENRK